MNNSYIRLIINNHYLQYLVLLIIAIVIWQIFYPGLMSPDSLAQYEQAANGIYDDWHPPLMSIILTVIIKLGGGIGLMIFIQCLSTLFGLRSVISLLIRFFSNNKITKSRSGVIATLLTGLFLIPLISPLILFSIIFWKDVWVAIISLWVISYFLWLIINQETLSNRSFGIHIILLSLSSAFMVLIRHNSIVILPVICIFCGFLSRIKFGRLGLTTIALPILFALILNSLIYSIFNVNRVYVSNTVLASDMTVMLRFYPELDSEFPLSARHKNAPIVLLTKDGGIWSETVSGNPCPRLNKKVCDPIMPLACFGNSENTYNFEGNDCYMFIVNDNKTLKNEYFNALTNHPMRMLYVKFYLFWRMLHPDNWHDSKVGCEIPLNSSGIELNTTYTEARKTICYLTQNIATTKWYLNWFSGIHLLWIILNALFLIYFVGKAIFNRDNKSVFSFLLFLIPFSYYLSYIGAATTPDYRFMYPSTLMMQIMFLALIFVAAPNIYQKFMSLDKATNSENDSKKREEIATIKKDWTPEEKAEIVIEGLKGYSEVEICNKYGVSQSQYAKWRDEFSQKAPMIFRKG